MRATLLYGAGDVRVENVPDSVVKEPTDALVRVTASCICGSDLHPYHSMASDRGPRLHGPRVHRRGRGDGFGGVVAVQGRPGRGPVRLLRRHVPVLPRRPARPHASTADSGTACPPRAVRPRPCASRWPTAPCSSSPSASTRHSCRRSSRCRTSTARATTPPCREGDRRLDRHGHRRRCGRPPGGALREAARCRADHPDGPAPGAHRLGPRVRCHRCRGGAR